MKISPITDNTRTFRANRRIITNREGKLLYRTTTYFLREDLNWERFANFLKNKYQSASKVNVINHACSSGHEPYSLALKLMIKFGVEAKKFFPINARDIDFDNIECARRGELGINDKEMYSINYCTRDNIYEFFDFAKAKNPQDDITLIPKPKLKEKVVFTQADILKDTTQKLPDNTVFMCRNIWPYLSDNNRTKLADSLAQNLGKNSLVVIGDFDIRNCNTDVILYIRGFRESGMFYVFEKP